MLNSFDKQSINKTLKKITTDVAWIQNTTQALANTDKNIRKELLAAFIVSVIFNLTVTGVLVCLIYLKLSR